jgi:hypothetical protein
MAFTGNYTCNTFKAGLIAGSFNFAVGTSDVYKIALYTNNATFDENTAAYTPINEVVAPGYAAGGLVLTPTVASLNNVSFVTFADVSWSAAITARGALIYKFGGTNPAICVLDFGVDKTSSTNFLITFPAATAGDAIIRIV